MLPIQEKVVDLYEETVRGMSLSTRVSHGEEMQISGSEMRVQHE